MVASRTGNTLLILLTVFALGGCRPTAPTQTADTQQPNQTINSVRDLAGKNVSYLTGAIFPQLTEPYVKGVNYMSFNDNSLAIQALRTKKVDAFLCDEPIARLTVAKFPQELRFVEIYAKDTYGIAFPKNSPLGPKAGKIIRDMKQSGEMKTLIDKWCKSADDSKKTITTWTHNKAYDGKAGVLRFQGDPTQEPMSYVGPKGDFIGLELDIVNRIAYDLNMTLKITPSDFGALIPALLSGRADVVASSMSITKERQEKVDFPEAHYEGGLSIVARIDADSASAITEVSQLYGKRIGVQRGSTSADLVKEQFISSTAVPFPTAEELPQALETGQVQAFLMDQPQARIMVRQHPNLSILSKKLSDDHYAFAFPLQKRDLQENVDKQLKILEKQGVLDDLKDKWFGQQPPQAPLPAPPKNPPNGTLTLAIDAQIRPFAFTQDGALTGYEIELAQRLAERMGYALNIVTMTWEKALQAVTQNQLDMLGGCVTVREERKKQLCFSTPIYRGGIVVVTTGAPMTAPQLTVGQWVAQSWKDLKTSFHRTLIQESRWKMLAEGLKTTLIITVCAALAGTVLSFLICFMRRSSIPGLSPLARALVSLMQGTPILVFLMILYYLIFAKVEISPILIAIIGFGLNFAAYVSEMIRTGLDAIPKGQYEAAMALGFTRGQTYVKVIIPQVLRRILPIYRGEFISMLKSTSIVGYIAIEDLTQMSDNIRSRTYEAFFPLILTSLIYFLTSYAVVLLLHKLDQHVDPIHRRNAAKGGQH